MLGSTPENLKRPTNGVLDEKPLGLSEQGSSGRCAQCRDANKLHVTGCLRPLGLQPRSASRANRVLKDYKVLPILRTIKRAYVGRWYTFTTEHYPTSNATPSP